MESDSDTDSGVSAPRSTESLASTLDLYPESAYFSGTDDERQALDFEFVPRVVPAWQRPITHFFSVSAPCFNPAPAFRDGAGKSDDKPPEDGHAMECDDGWIGALETLKVAGMIQKAVQPTVENPVLPTEDNPVQSTVENPVMPTEDNPVPVEEKPVQQTDEPVQQTEEIPMQPTEENAMQPTGEKSAHPAVKRRHDEDIHCSANKKKKL